MCKKSMRYESLVDEHVWWPQKTVFSITASLAWSPLFFSPFFSPLVLILCHDVPAHTLEDDQQ
jgi:hypothetical protein